ncbi:hypothetical protein ANN_03147 [Periplaneta americana]|uniref:DUF4817 domain-containing protein n=1 Tax=Periplaneta americana TaxID=6978 RepID=A0ABQ8TY78_PERAM|nr:hypothetical protein ANN_03147 [Periplaneta americana]
MYSNQELAEIHFMYGKADGNAALARRLYQERYPQRQCPDRKTFVRLHYRLCEYGKFNSPGLGRGRPRSTTPEVQEEILEAVNMTTPISTRRVALQVNVPHTTVWRLFKEYQLYPYHLQRVQALSPADYPARVRFCQWFLQQCGVNPNFPALVLFTDEAQFTRDGITNFHNQHVRAYENPRATVLFHLITRIHGYYGRCETKALYCKRRSWNQRFSKVPGSERIPNLSAEQSDGTTVFRISPMESLMLHRCRTGAISLQSVAQTTTYRVAMTAIDPSSSFVPISLHRDVIVVHRSGDIRNTPSRCRQRRH